MKQLEGQVRVAIRDAVNRPSRKPFYWGGLAGYQQLQAVAHGLRCVPREDKDTAYLQQLARQVERVLERNRVLATDLREAHDWLRRVAACLRYPPNSYQDTTPVTSHQVTEEMHLLLAEFRPDCKRQPAQAALYRAWQRLWRTCGADLLPCYSIPGLPPDNLQLEGFFGRLRRHQRRISGRKTTRELRDFGQYQALFVAQSEAGLLRQLQQVSPREYQIHRRRLEKAEAPRRFLHRLHRDPLTAIHDLLDRHAARRGEIAAHAPQDVKETLHTS